VIIYATDARQRPTRRLGPLSEDRKRDLLAVFRALAAEPHCRLSDIA
jgi:hypothetical protein